ncbi:SPFH domain-containing protein [Candidatus Uabimicrobium sp. HlEnr_7]|uniref:SPFH domain-containing protein n=1 Tax=Candidatus Uabimicrobium helgolandensis TaxID=3095367 RepID=UPI00355662B1
MRRRQQRMSPQNLFENEEPDIFSDEEEQEQDAPFLDIVPQSNMPAEDIFSDLPSASIFDEEQDCFIVKKNASNLNDDDFDSSFDDSDSDVNDSDSGINDCDSDIDDSNDESGGNFSNEINMTNKPSNVIPVRITNFENNPQNQEESMDAKGNIYMQQAIAEVDNLEKQLRVNRKHKKSKPAAPRKDNNTKIIEEEEKEIVSSLGVKVTGRLFKSVVVPPNMYVIHTRRGHEKPLHIGLGMSFRYNPRSDSFLVVPSSMQTILISANTICKELQGILIQAYVQWIIDDVETAYRRLDFSDAEDPMRVVTLQLREQAEAAIKDKVATMSINEVLSDKQPIIKELTKRLKEVAEGFGDDSGLGIKIITVQIKEAIVSSANLWQNLQKPFRSSQMAAARLAEIENQSTVNKRELEEEQTQQDAQQVIREKQLQLNHKIKTIELEKEFAQRQQNMELEIHSYQLKEDKIKAKRQIQELEMESDAKLRKRKQELEAHFEDLALETELQCKQKRNDLNNKQTNIELDFDEKRQKTANMLSQQQIQSQAIAMMPDIAKSLPHPKHSVNISGDGNGSSLPGIIASIISVLQSYGIRIGNSEDE